MQPSTLAERKSIVRDLLGSNPEENIASFASYFKLYDSLLDSNHSVVQIFPPALKSHDDVRRLALRLRVNPQSTRKDFRNNAFPSGSSDSFTLKDKQYAINVAVHLITMVDCDLADRHSEGYEVSGFKPVTWTDEEPFSDFISAVFPRDSHDQEKVQEVMMEKNSIKAWKLKKRAHVTLLPTDNLAKHLLYDPRDNVIHIFHHTAFLKAHLRLSAEIPIDFGFEESLKM